MSVERKQGECEALRHVAGWLGVRGPRTYWNVKREIERLQEVAREALQLAADNCSTAEWNHVIGPKVAKLEGSLPAAEQSPSDSSNSASNSPPTPGEQAEGRGMRCDRCGIEHRSRSTGFIKPGDVCGRPIRGAGTRGACCPGRLREGEGK